jgi:hypothetical protein
MDEIIQIANAAIQKFTKIEESINAKQKDIHDPVVQNEIYAYKTEIFETLRKKRGELIIDHGETFQQLTYYNEFFSTTNDILLSVSPNIHTQ